MAKELVKFPELVIVRETNFSDAYAELVRRCMVSGMEQKYGSIYRKDITATVELTGDAIKQIEERIVHPLFPTKKLHLDKYCKEFTEEYYKEEKTEEQEFDYTYYQRVRDQLVQMGVNLRQKPVFNNQVQVITWDKEIDSRAKSPPCLQRIWIRVLGDGICEVHITWRSRDLYGAWMSNIVGIMHMINEYVLKDDFKAIRIIDFDDSLHIYSPDYRSAQLIKPVYRLLSERRF